MIANFFNKSSPKVHLMLVGVFIIYYAVLMCFDIVVFNWLTVPLYVLLLVFSFVVNTKNGLTFQHAFTGLFLVILIGYFPYILEVNKFLFVNFTMMFAFRKMYSLSKATKIKVKVFDASLWLGVAFILEPLSILFLFFLYLAIIIFRRVSLSVIILPVLGFLTPLVLLYTYCLFFEEMEYFRNIFASIIYPEYKTITVTSVIYNTIFVAFFVLISLITKSVKLISSVNLFKSTWFLISVHLLLASILAIYTSTSSGQSLIYLIFPAAVILANGMEVFNKNLMNDGVLVLFFLNLLIPFLIS